MRDKTHLEQIGRWGEFVRDNPGKWKREHGAFIDAQIIKSWDFHERLKNTPNGLEKIKKLREMKIQSFLG